MTFKNIFACGVIGVTLVIPSQSQQPAGNGSVPIPGAALPPEGTKQVTAPTNSQPMMFRLHTEALGTRMKTAGKERAVFSGQFTDAQGKTSTVQITQQMPGLIEAVGIRPEGQALKFDGKRVMLPLAKSEEGFLESFTADTVEGLLEADRTGTAVRCLGYDFKSKTETKDHPELHFDIYQATLTSKTKPDGSKVTKLYWFETKTHLLIRTTYLDGQTQVETRFLDWGTSEGSKYPARVERYENNEKVFSFAASSVTAGPTSDVASFH